VTEKIAALENELAAATRRAPELESGLAEAREATTRAEEAARQATERAEQAVTQPVGAPAAGDTNDAGVAELQAEILQLETRLEQTELRARRAYAEAENAQAELRFARERGDAPQTSVDNSRLRHELAAALERAQAAEEGIKALRAEIILLKKGVNINAGVIEPIGTDEDGLEGDNGRPVDPEEEGVSLRTRLTRAVDSKRSSGDDDIHQWR
jgi:chromosome segregation ATPase